MQRVRLSTERDCLLKKKLAPDQVPSFPDPRRRSSDSKVYPYYAAFSPDFASAMIRMLCPNRHMTVLDPWNGSGTTTRAAIDLGHNSIGFDINPSMVVVARAACASPNVAKLVLARTQDLKAGKIGKAAPALASLIPDDDPFLIWFDRATVARLRVVTSALIAGEGNSGEILLPSVALLSDRRMRTSVALTSMFSTARMLLRPFQTTNPTWYRIRVKGVERISISAGTIIATLQNMVSRRVIHMRMQRSVGKLRISVANSAKLPSKDAMVDAVVTSPPYATRIDYAIASLPELAVLGMGMEAIRSLRQSMIGTTMVSHFDPVELELLGPTCVSFLNSIAKHQSRASSTYYLPNLAQYFGAIRRSLEEIFRVLRPSGRLAIVVQDSWYKDLRIPVTKIFVEELTRLGMRSIQEVRFMKRNTMRSLNGSSRAYGSPLTETESVIVAER